MHVPCQEQVTHLRAELGSTKPPISNLYNLFQNMQQDWQSGTIRNSNNKCSRNKIQSQTHDVYIGLKKKVKGILANAEGGKQVFNVLTVNSSSSSSPDSPNISAMRFLQKKLYLLISFPQGNYAVSITKNSSHWKSWHVCSWNSNTTASYSSTAFHLVTLLFVAIYTAELPLIVSDYKFVPLKMP